MMPTLLPSAIPDYAKPQPGTESPCRCGGGARFQIETPKTTNPWETQKLRFQIQCAWCGIATEKLLQPTTASARWELIMTTPKCPICNDTGWEEIKFDDGESVKECRCRQMTSTPTNIVKEAAAEYEKAHAHTPNNAIDEEWDKLSRQVVGQEE